MKQQVPGLFAGLLFAGLLFVAGCILDSVEPGPEPDLVLAGTGTVGTSTGDDITTVPTGPTLPAPAPVCVTVHETCDVFVGGDWWAVVQFNGVAWQDLTRVVAVVHNAAPFFGIGYPHMQVPVHIDDGHVAAKCEGGVGGVDFVTFVFSGCG